MYILCTGEYPHMNKTNFVVHNMGSERTVQLLIFLTFNKMRVFISYWNLEEDSSISQLVQSSQIAKTRKFITQIDPFCDTCSLLCTDMFP